MSNPDRFTKKPVTIDAILWTGENVKEVMDFLQWRNADHSAETGLVIRTLEGAMYASIGDYIIKGVKGEFYPCKPDIFAATYSPAVAPTEAAAMAATVPAEWLSDQVGGDFDDMTSGQGYRKGWNDCRKAMLAAQAPVAGQPAEPPPAWEPLTRERLRALTCERPERRYWLAPKDWDGVPIVGWYAWRQGVNPDGFSTDGAGRFDADDIAYIMRHEVPAMPDAAPKGDSNG